VAAHVPGLVNAADEFGASAPGPEVFAAFGFTPSEVAERARALMDNVAQDPRRTT